MNKDGCDVIFSLGLHISILSEDSEREFTFDIITSEEDIDIKIGEGKGEILNNPRDHDGLVDVADGISQECYEICRDIDPTLIEDTPAAHIVIIESIQIDQKYRGQGIGLKALKIICDFFWGDIVLLLPHPISGTCSEEKIPIATKKLQDYWKKGGFMEFKGGKVFYKDPWYP